MLGHIDGSEAEHEIDNEDSEDRPTKLGQCVDAGFERDSPPVIQATRVTAGLS